jgi:serine/threonine protein kinase
VTVRPRGGSVTGRVLAHYRVVERLGAGGMGEVYRAHDEKLDRDVALKVLPEGSLADEGARSRFQEEAHALSRLSHPHIATIHDFDTADGVDFLVMELVRGPSLRDELEEKGALPEKTVVRLGAQLAHGLQAAHEQGIVHRDLKPANLQLTPDGLLKILDFGLARLLPKEPAPGEETAPTQTAVRQVAGTLPYMSPEQLRGRGVDARTDLYAAGAVLYEMATGKRLFSKPSSAELTDAILHEEPTPPREVNERISPGLEAVILKALDKDPELRHQTAKDLRVDLERLQLRPDSRPSGSGPAREAEASVAEGLAGEKGARPSRGRSWRRAFGFVGAAAVLVALGANALWLSRPTPVPRITGVHALATLNPPNPAWNPILYVATDGERLYSVAVKGDRNVLRHVPLSGGESDETPLPFPGVVFLLSAIPGEPAPTKASLPPSPTRDGHSGACRWAVAPRSGSATFWPAARTCLPTGARSAWRGRIPSSWPRSTARTRASCCGSRTGRGG